MEFQDYAAKETSALFGRLRASQTGASLQQLQAIREAIDAAARAIETAPEPDQELDDPGPHQERAPVASATSSASGEGLPQKALHTFR